MKSKKIASLIGNDLVDGNILIPKSIIHENQEFFVTSIKNASFTNNSERENIHLIQYCDSDEYLTELRLMIDLKKILLKLTINIVDIN